MTLLYVTDAFAVYGGMERVLTDKMNHLAAHSGYDIVLLTVNQGCHAVPFPLHPQVKHMDLGVRLHQQYAYHGIRRFIKHLELMRLLKHRMRAALQQVNPDVLIGVKLDFVGVLNQVRENIPLIVESHTLCQAERLEHAGWLRRLHVWSFLRQVRQADEVVALTEGDARDWSKYHSQVRVIPNVVHLNNTETYRPCYAKSIMFVGRFTEQKDIDSLLKIWSLVHARHPDWTLEVYGDGDISAPGVQVHKPVSQMMACYMESSILVLTSRYEPFGLVLPEAMSCGLPVVAFDCPYGPGEIITDGVDGFLVKNRDVKAFADRVCQLIEHPELRTRMGQAGIRSSQRYRADVIMPRWKALFERVCQKG